MKEEVFYRNNRMTASLEQFINKYKSFEEFEREWSDELLNEDTRVGNYLNTLLIKYDKAAAAVSKDAGLAFAYVGNIINGKKNNPSRKPEGAEISISYRKNKCFLKKWKNLKAR